MRISDWSSDVCSSDLDQHHRPLGAQVAQRLEAQRMVERRGEGYGPISGGMAGGEVEDAVGKAARDQVMNEHVGVAVGGLLLGRRRGGAVRRRRRFSGLERGGDEYAVDIVILRLPDDCLAAQLLAR